MINKKNRNNDNELQKVLDDSQTTAEQGYKEANRYMKDIRRSVDSAGKMIMSCKKELDKYNVNDSKIVAQVQEQLIKVNSEFISECNEAELNLENKKRQSATFNITLFGRTMTGKSTLMEILTHGDGKSMGHGGQRTTRDVRTYKWRGMTVTDVPGVEAYDGKDDETIAEASAIYADLIIFLITAGQPEGTEADWLVKLKKKDKPMICVCNYKQAINDEHKLKRFLSSEERLAEKMNFDELIEQFNKFIQAELPNEKVRFLVTHLLAKFYSQQPQYKDKSKQLERFSRFNFVEEAIINEIVNNGKFYRQKCFLSIIDVPLYEQSVALFNFSTQSYNQSLVIKDKIKAFNSWQKNFHNSYYQSMHSDIDNIFIQLGNKIDNFAEDHAEDSNPGDAWNRVVDGFDPNGKLERCLQKIHNKCENDIQNIFRDLQQEMNFSFGFNSNFTANLSITNWRKGWGWASAISAGIGAIFCWNPVGWIAAGFSLIFGFFSWLSDSREEKLRENRQRLANNLKKQVDAMCRKAHGAATKWYKENIGEGIENIAYNRLRMMQSSMLTLTNSERKLAMEYTKNHVDVSKRIIKNVMEEIEAPQKFIDSIIKVARIPSKKTVIVTNNTAIPYAIKTNITRKIGNNETIVFYKYTNNLIEENQDLLAHSHNAWDRVCKAYENDEIISGYIKHHNTMGGLVVDIFGIDAFLPDSQIDVKPIRNYGTFVGKTMDFKIVKINSEYKNVIVSHKALIEANLEGREKKMVISDFKKSLVIESSVKNIISLFGYFHINTSVYVKRLEEDNQLVAFIENKDYTQEEKDNIILIQQILNIHIIPRNNENRY